MTNKVIVVTNVSITLPNGSRTNPIGIVKSPALAQTNNFSTDW